MQKWQHTINRIIKVTSCFVVIFMLILATVTQPALAAVDVQALFLKDYMVRFDVLENGYVEIDYSFDDIQPFLTVYEPGRVLWSGVHPYSEPFSTDVRSRDKIYWHEWPLGVRVNSSDRATSGVLDISDFKNHSTLTLKLSSMVKLDYRYYWEASGDASVEFLCNYYIFFFDKNGDPISGVRQYQSYNVDLIQELDDPLNARSAYLLGEYWDVEIPDGAQYMVPNLQVDVNLPGHESGAQIFYLSIYTDSFVIKTSYNSILEESETMHAIENHLGDINNQLGDLNDKTDQIINGTPDQQEHFQDVDDQITNTDQDLQQQLDQLDELENFDTSTLFGTINDFLEADGWKDIRLLLAPLLDWSHLATVMLFVFAFTTVRFLLLGR